MGKETSRLNIEITDSDIVVSYKCLSCSILFVQDVEYCPNCKKHFKNVKIKRALNKDAHVEK